MTWQLSSHYPLNALVHVLAGLPFGVFAPSAIYPLLQSVGLAL